MAQKTVIQPGVWVVLIALVLIGTFFGVKALQKNGSFQKITNAVAPTGNVPLSATIKPVKMDGKKPLLGALNTWVGFAPGVYYNGGFIPTAQSRYYSELGIAVQFVKMDNFDDSRRAWTTDQVDIICNTADVLSTEIPSFYIPFSPKVFMQIDWSRGGDKMVVRQGINTVADLKGKKIAVALNSPSQTLIILALEAGGLTWDDIKDNIVKCPTALEAATIFKAGEADAALVWAPDDADCIAAMPGSKVLISTAKARYAIADVFYVKDKTLQSRRPEIIAFVEGWLKAAAELNTSPQARATATTLMAQCFSTNEAVMDLSNARFATYGDNVNFFNLSPVDCKCVKGEDLYTKMAKAFYKIGFAPKDVPAWRDISDITILQSLKSKFDGPQHNAEDEITFTMPTKQEKIAAPVAVKRITINFATAVYKLSDDAKYTIDKDFANVAKAFAGYRVRIEGNTDNVGNPESNMSLSRKRAQSVANYLVSTYSFNPNRFIIIGNGQDKPVASNDTPEGKSENRRTDFELVGSN
jgi:NitT/TauT family transport system substrate-binding protein